MMKPEETKAGRWIEHNESKARRFIAGVKLNGDIIIELKSGGTSTMAVDWFKDWTLLPPESYSFDWQPETFPQYWTTLDSSASNTAFVKRYDSVRWHTVRRDGSESIDLGLSSDWNPDGRKQITEAEALALLDKFAPVESPDDWVTQDRVPARNGIDWGFFSPAIEKSKPFGAWLFKDGVIAAGCRHGEKMKWGDLLNVWCRRKDLPPVPEPVKPATRKVVLTEWLVEYQGSDVAYVVTRTHRPECVRICQAIGTREIEVPL